MLATLLRVTQGKKTNIPKVLERRHFTELGWPKVWEVIFFWNWSGR